MYAVLWMAPWPCILSVLKTGLVLSHFIRVTLISFSRSNLVWRWNPMRWFISNRRITWPRCECQASLWMWGADFFFFLSSNFWIIFLSIISTWINEWFAGIYLIEENKVTFVTLQNYEIKFKSAHITALHHHQELSFQHSAASGNPEGQHTVKSGCWTLRTAPAHCCWAPLFQMRPPFLSDAQSGQDHVAQGDTECIYTGSAAASTVGMLNARKLWIAVSTLLSNWASTVTPW